MAKTIETKVNRFDGGMVTDPRDPRESTCRVVTNFDIFSNPFKMTPYRDSESGDDAPTTRKIKNFAIGNVGSATYQLFGLGVDSSSNIRIYTKKLSTVESVGTADFKDDDWDLPSKSTGNKTDTDVEDFDFFTFYEKESLIFGVHAGTHIYEFDPTGVADFLHEAQALTYTNTTEGLVHSKDDILYVGTYNSAGGAGEKSKIAKKDGSSSWNLDALKLPDHLKPTSIAEFGNYLAIGLAPASGFGDSVVYLWDRNSSLTDVSESINWGEGELQVLEEIGGTLVGVTRSGRVGNAADSLRFNNRIIFKAYDSTYGAVQFEEFLSPTTGDLELPLAKQKIDNRLYFMAVAFINGVTRWGVWSVRRKTDGRFAIAHERTPENDIAYVSGNAELFNFFVVSDYMFISYKTSTAVAMSKTNNEKIHNHLAIYESKRFDAGEPSLDKTLIGFSIFTEPLASGTTTANVDVFFKIDAQTSFTKFMTHSTAGATSKSAKNIESSGVILPVYKEIEFKIEAKNTSTGEDVPEITGYEFEEKISDKRVY